MNNNLSDEQIIRMFAESSDSEPYADSDSDDDWLPDDVGDHPLRMDTVPEVELAPIDEDSSDSEGLPREATSTTTWTNPSKNFSPRMRVPELSIPQIGAKVARMTTELDFFNLFSLSACYFI